MSSSTNCVIALCTKGKVFENNKPELWNLECVLSFLIIIRKHYATRINQMKSTIK